LSYANRVLVVERHCNVPEQHYEFLAWKRRPQALFLVLSVFVE
jgi:hypothetical protein